MVGSGNRLIARATTLAEGGRPSGEMITNGTKGDGDGRLQFFRGGEIPPKQQLLLLAGATYFPRQFQLCMLTEL